MSGYWASNKFVPRDGCLCTKGALMEKGHGCRETGGWMGAPSEFPIWPTLLTMQSPHTSVNACESWGRIFSCLLFVSDRPAFPLVARMIDNLPHDECAIEFLKHLLHMMDNTEKDNASKTSK